jgi:hypothetical protein
MENNVINRNLKEYSDMKNIIYMNELLLGGDIVKKYFNYSGSGWTTFINLKTEEEFEEFMVEFLENQKIKIKNELKDFFELNNNN